MTENEGGMKYYPARLRTGKKWTNLKKWRIVPGTGLSDDLFLLEDADQLRVGSNAEIFPDLFQNFFNRR
jgi:hypothetical protein